MSSAGVALSPSPISILPPLCSGIDESIIIYLAMSGSVIPMRVLESDSIESVKLQIQNCKGFVVKNQKLVCGGRELARNNSMVRDYGVMNGNILHLVLKLSDLQVISVKTTTGKEFIFHVERYRDVKYVKQQIAKKENNSADNNEDHEVFCNGERLESQKLIHDICKHNDAVIHLLVRKSAKVRSRQVAKDFELSIEAPDLSCKRNYRGDREGFEISHEEVVGKPRKPPDRDFWVQPIIVNPKIEVSEAVKNFIRSTAEGLEGGNSPIMSTEGTGGAYFMKDLSGDKFISVFKPIDEEPMAVNNPQGLPLSKDGEGLKRGTRVGEGAFREVAAYILDHPKNGRRPCFNGEAGFSGVPLTCLVECFHKGFNHPRDMNVKVGSLQKFMENCGSCEDMGPGAFPLKEVHKISVLDIRLANADRHAGNILVQKQRKDGQIVLIPIDHGYCLPESFEDCTFDWIYWPQAREPYGPDTIEYIKSLDAEEDIALLKLYGWELSPQCARTLRISTMLLKKGAARGLSPFEIGNIMCRETVKKESVIEEIVREAENSTLPGTSEIAFHELVSEIMERRLGGMVK